MLFPKKMEILVLLAASFGVQCAPLPHVELSKFPELPPALLTNAIRELIRPDCGSCHTASLPTAKTAALEVFDLDKEAWSESMTVEQLESFGRRLRGNKNDTLRVRAAAFVAEQIEEREQKTHPDSRNSQND
ncbi:MAG: hypothetical protein WD182_01405 [Bacteroidota bacterium]